MLADRASKFFVDLGDVSFQFFQHLVVGPLDQQYLNNMLGIGSPGILDRNALFGEELSGSEKVFDLFDDFLFWAARR